MFVVVLIFVFALFLLMWLAWLAAGLAIGATLVVGAGRLLTRILHDASAYLGNRTAPRRRLGRADDVQFLRDIGIRP